MSSITDLVRAVGRGATDLRAGVFPTISLDEWARMFNDPSSNGFSRAYQTLRGEHVELSDSTFLGHVQAGYRSNGIVFACMLVRMMVFSEARFQFQQVTGGSAGELFGNPDLAILERPWANATTGDLLARMMQDADLAGNNFTVRRPGNPDFLKRLRPDWTAIVLGSDDSRVDPDAVDAQLAGYMYVPGGFGTDNEPDFFLPEEMSHFAPIPDPLATYRGMSWLTPIVREIAGDTAATMHKNKFFENGATPNLVISLDPKIEAAKFREWVRLFKDKNEGVKNAYRTMYLGAGADVTVVGRDLQQLDFKVTQGAGETRIAAAAGTPPVIVGLSEGLQGSSLNAGNYNAAKRRLGDITIRPLWRNAAGSLQSIVKVPRDGSTRLWYDAKDVPFLAEDQKDAADVQSLNAQTIKALIDAGFEPDDAVKAVMAGDLKKLVGNHTGLFSVQLQPPNSSGDPEQTAAVQAGRALAALIEPHLNNVAQLTPGGQA